MCPDANSLDAKPGCAHFSYPRPSSFFLLSKLNKQLLGPRNNQIGGGNDDGAKEKGLSIQPEECGQRLKLEGIWCILGIEIRPAKLKLGDQGEARGKKKLQGGEEDKSWGRSESMLKIWDLYPMRNWNLSRYSVLSTDRSWSNLSFKQ